MQQLCFFLIFRHKKLLLLSNHMIVYNRNINFKIKFSLIFLIRKIITILAKRYVKNKVLNISTLFKTEIIKVSKDVCAVRNF